MLVGVELGQDPPAHRCFGAQVQLLIVLTKLAVGLVQGIPGVLYGTFQEGCSQMVELSGSSDVANSVSKPMTTPTSASPTGTLNPQSQAA